MHKFLNWAADQLLSRLQRNCRHPSDMVTVDLLEGGAPGIQIKWCRRCGAVKTDWDPIGWKPEFIAIEHWWRRPDPNLWRGR